MSKEKPGRPSQQDTQMGDQTGRKVGKPTKHPEGKGNGGKKSPEDRDTVKRK